MHIRIRILFLVAGIVCIVAYILLHTPIIKPAALSGSTTEDFPILILGDSLAAGVGASDSAHNFANQFLADLQVTHPNATMHNLGVSGAKVDDVLTEQSPQANKTPAKLILLIVGTNDILQASPVANFISSYQKLIDTLAAPGKIIVVLNLPHFSLTPIIPEGIRSLADRRTTQYNDNLVSLTARRADIRLVDFYTISGERLLSASNLISEDGFHPNDAGYELMAKLVIAKLQ